MVIKSCYTFTFLIFWTVKADPDPLTFIASTPTPIVSPSVPPEFDGKEVIVFLTPGQIAALKTGQGFLEPIFESEQTQSEDDQRNEDLVQIPQNGFELKNELRRKLDKQKAYLKSQRNVVILQDENEPAPVKEPSQEETWYSKESNKYIAPAAKLERNRYAATSEIPERNRNFASTSKRPTVAKYFASTTENPEDSKHIVVTSEKPDDNFNYYSVYNEKKGDNIDIKIYHPSSKDRLEEDTEAKGLESYGNYLLNKNYKLIHSPFDYLNRKLKDDDELVKSQKSNLHSVTEEEIENINKNDQNLDEENAPKYLFRYNDQKHAIEIQKLIKKTKAQVEVKTSQPEEFIAKVNKAKKLEAPKHQPYLVRILRPEIKASQAYSLPLEIVRHIPVDIQETDTEKPIPYEVKRVNSKKVYVKDDKPYLIERIVPVEVKKK